MTKEYDVHSLKQHQSWDSKDDIYRFKVIFEYCFGDVLDVGCGLGLLKNYLDIDNSKVNKYIGLDVDGKIDVHGSVYDLPFILFIMESKAVWTKWRNINEHSNYRSGLIRIMCGI